MPDTSQLEIDDVAPIYRCMTKGVGGAPEEFEYGLKWVTSRRAFLKVFRDRLECGDWNIPYSAIEEAELFRGSLGQTIASKTRWRLRGRLLRVGGRTIWPATCRGRPTGSSSRTPRSGPRPATGSRVAASSRGARETAANPEPDCQRVWDRPPATPGR